MPDFRGDVCLANIAGQRARTATIRRLNDAFRTIGGGGIAAVTPGIKALGTEAFATIVDMVRDYGEFDSGNDPHGEHDMGSLTYDGARIFWKIDYYDNDLASGSPNPADATCTTRVLTIMLASEY